MMRSGGVADELPDDSIDIEDIKSPRERMRSLVAAGVVILSLLLVTLLIIFGIIPLVKQIETGADAVDRLEYLYGEFKKNKYDPEVSAIISAYESSYGTVFSQSPSDLTTLPETESETTSETTTAATELSAILAETTTSEETTTSGETAQGED